MYNIKDKNTKEKIDNYNYKNLFLHLKETAYIKLKNDQLGENICRVNTRG